MVNRVRAERVMYIRLVARLLFCVALLAQVGAPLAGAAAHAIDPGGALRPFQALCQLLHEGDDVAAVANSAAKDAEKAPRGEHRHHDCPLCPFGASAALWEPSSFTGAVRVVVFSSPSPKPAGSILAPQVLRRGAAPRAPPFLVSIAFQQG
jgi:hypothetical protein